MALADLLNRYTGTPQPQADTPAHFDEAAQSSSVESLGSALSSMFRSDATPPFGQLVGSLFDRSNPEQRAGVLNHLVEALGPGAAGVGGGILGKILGNTGSSGAAPSVTPEQASKLSPSEVTTLAAHAEQHDPSVVDRVGTFYAAHPTLVKSLGGLALAVALGHLRK